MDIPDTNLEALSGRWHAPSASEADAPRKSQRRPRGLSRTIKVVQTAQRTAETRPRVPHIPPPPCGTGRLAYGLPRRPGRATQDQARELPGKPTRLA